MDKNIPIVCPECGKVSRSVKHYIFIEELLFLFFMARCKRVPRVCCDECMKKHIRKMTFSLWNIIGDNVLWILLILPWALCLLLMNKTKGHSKKVLKMIAKGD